MKHALKHRGRGVALAGLLVGVAVAAAAAQAADSPAPAPSAPAAEPLPLSALVALPRFVQPVLSPDGRSLAVLAPLKGKRNLMVVDLKTMQGKAITGFNEFDVVDLTWVGSQRLVFTLGRLDTPTGAEYGDGGGLFTVRTDGSGYRKLNPTLREQRASNSSYRLMSLMAPVPGSDHEILVRTNQRSAKVLDIYRVDLDSGERKLLTLEQPGHVVDWVLDAQGLPRAAMVVDDPELEPEQRRHRLMVRASVGAPWVELASFEAGSKDVWDLVAFAANDQDLIVSARNGRDTAGLHLLSVSEKRLLEVIAQHPRYDLSGGLIFDPRSHRPVGLSFQDEQVQTAYFDEGYAALQRGLERQFPDKAVRLQRSQGTQTLVQVWSDRSVPTFYLYDDEKKTLEELLRSRDDLPDDRLVSMRSFLLKTRDGLEIPSYYFLPADYQPGQRLPTVVHVHGGPHSRSDTWGFGSFGVREAQILASRGYAVVLPNFRITPGLGRKIYQAGFGQIGRTMSEDHEDAALWAVQQGFADRDRLCISGASYGGYATLWALIKTPELFKCGVAGLVVSDYQLQLESNRGDTSRSKAGVAFWRRLLGLKPGEDWSRAHEVSPAYHAERLKGALFIYAGADDVRTPIEQTERMVKALNQAGHPPDVVLIKQGEAHGYGKVESNLELYTKMLDFLDRQIGPASLKR